MTNQIKTVVLMLLVALLGSWALTQAASLESAFGMLAFAALIGLFAVSLVAFLDWRSTCRLALAQRTTAATQASTADIGAGNAEEAK